MKILLAEDMPDKEKMIADYLTEKGHEITCVSDEKAMKDRLKTDFSQYNLVLLDMVLPQTARKGIILGNVNLSGIKILNTMKIFRIDIPVIVMTQYWDFMELTQLSENIPAYSLWNELKNNTEVKSSNSEDIRYLDALHMLMCERYTNYVGSIVYSDVNNQWKYKLDKMMGDDRIKNENISS